MSIGNLTPNHVHQNNLKTEKLWNLLQHTYFRLLICTNKTSTMKRLIYALLIGLALSSCSHRIVRIGYYENTTDATDCDVVISKNVIVPDSVAKKIGNIRLGETGFSVACSEEHAIKILKKEYQQLPSKQIQRKKPFNSLVWKGIISVWFIKGTWH